MAYKWRATRILLPLVAILKTLVATCGLLWPTCEMFAGKLLGESGQQITLALLPSGWISFLLLTLGPPTLQIT